MYEAIKLEIIGHAAIVTLNRPNSLNAFTYPMMDEFGDAIAQAEKNQTVTGIIVTGEGKGFCAGVDMSTLNTLQEEGQGSQTEKLQSSPGNKAMGDDFTSGFTYLMSVRKPILAAVNGACAGLGLSIALLCDMRFAADKAKFVTSFSPLGLVAEHGQSWILPRILNPSRALDLLWSSRRVDAQEALGIGMVDRVFSPETLLKESANYIETLAKTASPTSLMLMKRQVYRHLNMTLGEAMVETNHLMDESMVQEDFEEGIAAFAEKRLPKFRKIEID
jgi:enoyl-CoA hydratase/carnithine racemase